MFGKLYYIIRTFVCQEALEHLFVPEYDSVDTDKKHILDEAGSIK